MVRRQGMQYWINFFQELAESGFHDGGYLDQELSRFCFLEMVQKTLDDISLIWNRHRIRPYRQRIARCGRPFMLHYMPSVFDTVNYGLEINENDIQVCERELEPVPPFPCSELIKELCICIMEENGLAQPQHPDEMRELYIFLRENMINHL
ncbi:uncharacterized protein LOC128156857 [Crassostrea angulata]|uniref:uncharacterized protein LOC128156857 n=1 Tax=Magallana angulata TaxID=2784310 RepID=UPI0022B0C038|nr:uncharacterized protein LOC128156857 [Crassostrea angulata]